MKFRKSMNLTYFLFPVLIISIGVPIFYLSYTIKDLNNAKKILQEAAYTGALAAANAIDVSMFESNKELGRENLGVYPVDDETGAPVSFMVEKLAEVRKGNLKDPHDCLNGRTGSVYSPSSDNKAATEVIQAVDEFIQSNLNTTIKNKTPYSNNNYSVAIKFERDGITYPNGDSNLNSYSGAPYNKVTVTVMLDYKPIMYKKLLSNGDSLIIGGTSSAKTKTIT